MRRFLVTLMAAAVLLLAAPLASCSSGLKLKSDGTVGAGVGAGWDKGPAARVDGKLPGFEFDANTGAVPGAVPFAPGATPETPAAPALDPAVLSRLDDIAKRIEAAEAAGTKTPEEIAALRAELELLRQEEREAPAAPPVPAPVPTVVERAPGFIARVLSGQIVEAVTGPEGLIATLLLLWGGAKARRKWVDGQKRKKARIDALDRAVGIVPKPPGTPAPA
jgi:hypothetical protein